MKRIFIIIVAMLMVCDIKAQITILSVIEKKEEIQVIAPYDSLFSINKDNYKSHIGQTLYLMENKEAKKHGYYFYEKPYSNWNAQRKYNPINNGTAMYDYLKGRYFYVNEIIDIVYEDGKNKFFLQLIEKETKDTVYSDVLNHFLTVGYYEKLKSKYIGKKYVCQIDFDFFSVETLKRDKSISKGTVLECVDLPFAKRESVIKSTLEKDDEVPEIVALLESDKYGKCICSFRLVENTNMFSTWAFKQGRYKEANYSWEILPLKSYEDLEKEAAVKKDLAKKYGQSNANLIVQGKVRIGFTKQMCREAWGEPEDINTTTGSYGKHEQWVYDDDYLYFENGKLTAIQD
jgi:hypothetical protein